MTIAAVVPTVCLALALVVAIGPRRIRVGAVVLSLAIAASGLLGAYAITREWSSFAPVAEGWPRSPARAAHRRCACPPQVRKISGRSRPNSPE